jgi:hypothetical protein
MDVYKQRVDFEFLLTKNQPFVFDAATGDSQPAAAGGVNAFPTGAGYGELICFAVSTDGTALANFNNLAGTATLVADGWATEYNAWAFKAVAAAPTGDLDLNGTEYDSCPAYLFGQFSPRGANAPGGGAYDRTVINISSCKQDLRQDYTWNFTKLQFDVWKYDEKKLTGAYECANSFFEDSLDGINVASRNFSNGLVRGPGYYRVQGVASSVCNGYGKVYGQPSDVYATTSATGLVGVQTSYLPTGAVSAELGAGNTVGPAGYVKWDAFSGLTGGRR